MASQVVVSHAITSTLSRRDTRQSPTVSTVGDCRMSLPGQRGAGRGGECQFDEEIPWVIHLGSPGADGGSTRRECSTPSGLGFPGPRFLGGTPASRPWAVMANLCGVSRSSGHSECAERAEILSRHTHTHIGMVCSAMEAKGSIPSIFASFCSKANRKVVSDLFPRRISLGPHPTKDEGTGSTDVRPVVVVRYSLLILSHLFKRSNPILWNPSCRRRPTTRSG